MPRFSYGPLLAITVALVGGASIARSAFAAAPASQPASRPATQPAKTGQYQLTFTEKSPLSDTAAIVKRMGWKLEDIKALKLPFDYEIAKETFDVYVPPAYTGAEPYGLLVWISPSPRGTIDKQWLEVIDRHKLIVIGANNAGNPREIWNRMALALDAPHNMKSRYNLDPARIYVAGSSGGGRTASQLGIAYADIFRGGMYLIGCNYFRSIETEKGSGKVYRASFARPVPNLFTFASKRSRHVLLTGETDANRPQTKLNFAAMQKDGFKFATYLEVPGMGHGSPDAVWFEKGIVALDRIVPEPQKPATKTK